MTTQQAYDFLTAAYQAEVTYRHRDYCDDDATKKNIAKLAQYLTSSSAKFGMMFCGICGNGKTTLLRAFQSALNYLIERRYVDAKGIRIIDAKDVQHFARDYKDFNLLKSEQMLAIEDMGREATEVMDYGNILNPVVDLLEHRYNEQLFTMITTNLTAEQIRAKYGNRLADRFNEMLEVIIFGNDTYRKKSP